MYRGMRRLGVGLVLVGLVAAILSYAWEVPYGGPMTGLGPALLLLAAFGLMALGALLALIAFVLGLASGTPGKRTSDDTRSDDR